MIRKSKNTARVFLAVVAVTALASTVASVSAQEYLPGPIAYWKLDDGSGATAVDSIGANHGAVNGATWTSGQVDGALSFDGVDDHVVAMSPTSASTPDAITFEAWVNFRTLKTDWFPRRNTILEERELDENDEGVGGYYLCYEGWNYGSGGGSWTADLMIDGTPKGVGVTDHISLNTWYHVAVTYDGSFIRLYVNGNLLSSSEASGNISPSAEPLAIGKPYHPLDSYADAMIDEVAVYDRALSAEELEQHYQNGLIGQGYDVPIRIAAIADSFEVYPGDIVAVDLDVQGASDLYGAQASCAVDPAILEVQSGVFGDFFDPVNRLIGTNQVDAVAGTWTGAISQRSPAEPLSGDGLFATVTYQALSPGTTSITCDVLLSDRDGLELPVTFTGAEVTVLPYASIDGVATYQGRLAHAGIDVTATGTVTRADTTDLGGNFTLDELRAGSYDVVADAPGYLPACTTQTLNPGDEVTLPVATLAGGDGNDDGVINIGDATLIGNSFGLDVPPGAPQADINADGVVNVQDLAILGGNYELVGCQSW